MVNKYNAFLREDYKGRRAAFTSYYNLDHLGDYYNFGMYCEAIQGFATSGGNAGNGGRGADGGYSGKVKVVLPDEN